MKLGAILNLTTAQSVYGTPMVNGVKLAVEHINAKGGINGRMIELLTEDAADTATTALNAYNKMMEKKPLALVGPILGFQMIPFREKIDKDQIPIISLSGTRGWTMNNNKFGFRTAEFDGNSKPALAHFIVEKLGVKKVGIITTANEWGYSGRDHVAARLKTKHNITPAAIESYQPTDKDMLAQLLNLKKAGVDIIVSQGHPADNAILFKQYKQFNIGIPRSPARLPRPQSTWTSHSPRTWKGSTCRPMPCPGMTRAKRSCLGTGVPQEVQGDPGCLCAGAVRWCHDLRGSHERAEKKGNLTRQSIADEMWKTDFKGLIARYQPDVEDTSCAIRSWSSTARTRKRKSSAAFRSSSKTPFTLFRSSRRS